MKVSNGFKYEINGWKYISIKGHPYERGTMLRCTENLQGRSFWMKLPGWPLIHCCARVHVQAGCSCLPDQYLFPGGTIHPQ